MVCSSVVCARFLIKVRVRVGVGGCGIVLCVGEVGVVALYGVFMDRWWGPVGVAVKCQ